MIGRGGLHIIGSEKHVARRIDRQLRGRSGGRATPVHPFLSFLEDDLMRLFGGDRITNIMSRMGGAEQGERIEHPLITRSIERAQKKVEERNSISAYSARIRQRFKRSAQDYLQTAAEPARFRQPEDFVSRNPNVILMKKIRATSAAG